MVFKKMLEIKPQIEKIQIYVPGKSKSGGIKLSSNENPLGCSPKAIEAFHKFTDFNRYPDGSAAELKKAIAEVHGLDAEKIVCGSGSDDILELIPIPWSGVGDEIIYTEHGFLIYPFATLKVKAQPVKVAEVNFRTDIKAVIDAVTPKTKMVYLANPNNPTGTYLTSGEMRELRERLPKDVMLVIDAAYAECVTADDYTDGRELVDEFENTIMTHTFSKMYGLANMRLGWSYSSKELAQEINRVRSPFNITGPSLMMGVAAVRDREFLEMSIQHNEKWRGELFAELQANGFTPVPSQGNFVMAKFGDSKSAARFFEDNGIIIRDVANYGLPEYLRISVGTEDEMNKFFAALREYKKQLR